MGQNTSIGSEGEVVDASNIKALGLPWYENHLNL